MDINNEVQEAIEIYGNIEITDKGRNTIIATRALFEHTKLTVEEIAELFNMPSYDLQFFMALGDHYNI
jgi:hypothetical protein